MMRLSSAAMIVLADLCMEVCASEYADPERLMQLRGANDCRILSDQVVGAAKR